MWYYSKMWRLDCFNITIGWLTKNRALGIKWFCFVLFFYFYYISSSYGAVCWFPVNAYIYAEKRDRYPIWNNRMWPQIISFGKSFTISNAQPIRKIESFPLIYCLLSVIRWKIRKSLLMRIFIFSQSLGQSLEIVLFLFMDVFPHSTFC